jgi:hypothetical protein
MRRLFVFAVILIATGATARAQSKRSMAVEDFSWATVQTAVQSIFGTNVNIGTGVQALMVKRIA